MEKVQSIRSVFFRYVLWLIVVSTILSGILKVGMEWQRSHEEFGHIRESYISNEKMLLKERVNTIFRFIDYQRNYTEKKICELRKDWIRKTRTLVPFAMQVIPSGKSLKHQQKTAINFLKKLNSPSRFGITAIDTATEEILSSSLSTPLTREQRRSILDHANDSPFETDGLIGQALTFPSIRLCIAVLEPRAQQEKWLQNQVLKYTGALRFGKEGYVFINTFDGIPLLRDGKQVKNGKTMWELTDPDGVKVIQEEYEAATKNGGDFIFYSWRKLSNDRVMAKMSYIRGLNDWKWMVGTGMYMDEMEAAINQKKAEFMRHIRLQASLALLGFLLILAVIFLLTKRMGQKLSSEFDVFSDFFQDCTTAHRPIDTDLLKLSEFKILAKQANTMVVSRKRVETALKKSEEKFRKLFEKSRDAMSILSRDGLIDCNQALLTLFHASNKSEMLVPPWKLSPKFQPDGRSSEEKAKKLIRSTYETGSTQFEWMHRKLSGEDFWCELTLTRIPWDQEDCIFVVWRDISKSKIALDQLQHSEIRLRKSQELSRAGNWEVDLINGHYIASDEAYRIYGYNTVGAITSFKEVSRAIHPEDRERVEVEFRDFIIHGTPYDTTFRIRRINDGEIRFLRSIAERVTDGEGRAIHVLGVIQDITELIEKEHEARTEHEKMKITLASMTSAVIATDNELKVELMNPVAEKLTGWKQSEAVGQALDQIYQSIDPETRKPISLPDPTRPDRTQATQSNSTSILLGKDGEEHVVLCSNSAIQWKDSGFLGLVLVFRDITERLKMEQELQKTQRLESLGVLAGGIAHDFNNQMTGITGNISLVKAMLKDSPQMTTLLNEAEKASNTCKALARQLLTFASGGAPLTETVNLEELIRDSVSFNLRGKPVNAKVKIAKALWNANVDPGQFRQVMSNLLINAVQAMPDGGTVQVYAKNAQNSTPSEIKDHTEGKFIHVSISDTGPGIDPEIQSKIFDPFFTTKEEGSGLGLSTVHSIVKRHGGQLSLTSTEGKGTTFTLLLPAAEKQEIKPVATVRSNPVQPLNILLMDDEEIIRDVAQEIFRFLGHSITS
ncbi:MAG: PAS domain S-box protein, partial [Acidobacteria bacterium]|nr:PAS domain S-box protein [Acidobacteriota bacterium]